MTSIERRLAASDPLRPEVMRDPQVLAALDRLDDAIASTPRPVRRASWSRRRRLALLATGLMLAVGGSAGAAGWLPAHTGIFGDPGLTESDTSEFLRLGSPELRDIALREARAFPLPSGGSYEPAIAQLTSGSGLMQATGVRRLMATASACQWEAEWLAATRAHDSARATRAVRVLARVPRWDVLRATDGGGVIAGYRRIAAAARDGDARPVAADVASNCAGVLP
jgi:hypothetical protein